MFRLKVKEVAAARGLSQGRLSRLADVDINTVRRIYRYPDTSITLHVLDRLASALHVDIRDLIESIPEEEK